MNVEEILPWLTDGLDDTQKAAVVAAVTRDSVKTKLAGVKAQSEFDKILAERQALQQELEGEPNKPGAKAYREWYEKNASAAIENDKKIREFDAKHGDGAFLKLAAGDTSVIQPATTVAATAAATGLTRAEVEAMIASNRGPGITKEDLLKEIATQFQEKQAPNISNVLKTTGRIIQRHILANRGNEVDFDALEKIMDDRRKIGRPVDIEEAYAEWDKPVREKLETESREKEIQRRVDEEIQKRGANKVPAGADMTPGSLARHSGESEKNFSKTDLVSKLAGEWTSASSGRAN